MQLSLPEQTPQGLDADRSGEAESPSDGSSDQLPKTKRPLLLQHSVLQTQLHDRISRRYLIL